MSRKKPHYYQLVAQAYIKTLSADQKKTFAYAPGAARDRCSEKGLFQGRTENNPDGPSTARGRRRRSKRGGTERGAA